MLSSANFRVLLGLPGIGSPPKQFSATGLGLHREGYVIEFMTKAGEPWVGNFQPGLTSFYQAVHTNNTDEVTIISGGQAYVVNVETSSLICEFGGSIEFTYSRAESGAFVISNGIRFEQYLGSELLWRTRRLSWDGIQNITVVDDVICGEGWGSDSEWHSFEIQFSTGFAKGGGYDGPDD